MIRAVVATNVWVSAFLQPGGPPAQVLGAFIEARFVAVLPPTIPLEIRAVLARPRIRRRSGHTDAEADEYVRLISERAEPVAVTGRRLGCRDPHDDALLEAALAAKADVLVTRDDDLKGDPALMARMRAEGVAILSVFAFLVLLDLDA